MLAVVGSGEYLPAMGDVDRQLIELFDAPPTEVCLPTAAGTGGDALIDSWMQRGVDHFTSLGAATTAVRVWDLDTANDPTLNDTIAADANTALVDVDGTFRAIGDRVTIWTETDRTEFGPGDVPADVLSPVGE